MSVNRAYITSLWTTGILVASSFFVLALTSAIVAFDRWPGSASVAPIDHVTVSPSSSVPAGAAAARPPVVVPVHVRHRTTRRAATAPTSPAPVRRTPSAPQSTPPARTPTTATPTPAQTSQPQTGGGQDAPPPQNPAPRQKGGPGDYLRQTGGTLGGQIGTVSPQAGSLVVTAADATADDADGVYYSLPQPSA